MQCDVMLQKCNVTAKTTEKYIIKKGRVGRVVSQTAQHFVI